jgi:serine/threonine protein kinase
MSHGWPLLPAPNSDRMKIQSLLGAGGMGEVHPARDTRLSRDVAIKVLPEAFARYADRLQRFEHEARVLSTVPRRRRRRTKKASCIAI